MGIFKHFLILSLFIYSCSGDRNNFKVEVNVNGSHNEMLYLALRTISGTTVVDSAMPDKSGKYILKGYTQKPDFYVVYHDPAAYINLIIHPGDDFRVLSEAETFDRNYLVEGSADSRLIQKMVNMQTRTLEKITHLSNQYESSRGLENFEKIKAEIDSTYERVFNEHKEFSIKLIEENPRSLVSLMALYQQLGRNVPVFDYKKDFKYYERVDSNLSHYYPNSEAVVDLNRKVTELRAKLSIEPGTQAPALSLPDKEGKMISLSSLKGKNVVLFFWASWSSQSLADLNSLQNLYRGLRDEVEYYQVSLDRTRESWLKHVNDAGIHVSDLKYWDSPVVRSYQIEKLPVIFLLDKDGKIITSGFQVDELPRLLSNVE